MQETDSLNAHESVFFNKMAVTIATWRQVGYDKDGDGDIDVDDLKKISDNDVVGRVMRPHYWNRWKADRIASQSVANIAVDWAGLPSSFCRPEIRKVPEKVLFWGTFSGTYSL